MSEENNEDGQGSGNKRRRPIDIVIAEKNPLLMSSLIKLFAGDDRFALVATTPDGERFISAVERLTFDVAIIGWEMPYMDGRGVLQALQGRSAAPRVIVYTGSASPEIPRVAMSLGAAGFCSKSDPPAQLLETVAAVADGRMMFPFVDVSQLANDPFSGLTPRERELLAALASGLTNAQIAGKLDISLNTVKFHLKNLYDKLGVSNRAQAVAHYLKGREGR
ncbi:LuxR C-terminal-related transcriptional regulator [Insolitispirillum peregrinum]|uniref:Two component transcriptional regulator, LuxR family n=1 Tax=Insolitispirillum peregrinum TaxID=80876 RepID=A0A1N7NNU5_9PROT|nr:response regulator transcription factor [Insolitispirillum peregrinum]SIT00004.1 two component transcriptional regulator, LuxR family [Insolitispirillum peregrinum]